MNSYKERYVTPNIYSTFMRVPEFVEGLMSNLSATHVSIITKLLDYNMNSFQKNKYLNPLRDIIEYKPCIDNKIASGYYVSVIGKDIPKLISRIKDPVTYYNTNQHKERITIWLAIVPKNKNSIQNSIQIRDTTINLQSVFLLPSVDFSMYFSDSCFIENNGIHFNTEFVNKYPNIVYNNNKVWFSHIPYNNDNIDVMFFMTPAYIRNREAKVYLSTLNDTAPHIIMFDESNTQNEHIGSSEDEDIQTVATYYMNIFSSRLSVGYLTNNYFSSDIGNKITLRVDCAYRGEFSDGYGVICIPLDYSNSDSFRSTNMNPEILK